MRAGVGTLEWAARTGGKLRPMEKLSQLADAVLFQLRVLPAQAFWKLGVSPPKGPGLDLGKVMPPDTATAKRALEMCESASSPHLANHCLRSYLWARMFAAQDGVRFDDELLYVGCLMHDLGLTKAHVPGRPDVHCFSLASAEAAETLAREQGWEDTRTELLAEAITLHLNVRVGLDHGPEAHLLNAATALDVGGVRYWDAPAAAIRSGVARYPRLDFKAKFPREWRDEAGARPCSRAAFLERYLRFGRRIAGSPFEE